MEMDRAAKRKLIAKAYEQLSDKSKLSDTGEYLGLWGYLHKRQTLKKTQSLPNKHRGLITCSNEEYMQLYLKSKRMKSMLSQLPVQTTTNLSIDLSRSDNNLLPEINSKTENVQKIMESCQKTMEKSQVEVSDLQLNGQLIQSEKKFKKKSHSRKDKNTKVPQSPIDTPKRKDKKKRVKKERILDDLEITVSTQEVHYYQYSADADHNKLETPLIVVAEDNFPAISDNNGSSANILSKGGSESQLLNSGNQVQPDYAQSFNNLRRQCHVDHGIFSKVRNAAKFSLSVRDQIDTRRTSKSIGNAVDSQNQLDKTSRPVSHMSLAEDNSNVGVAVKSKNDLVCTEDEHKFSQSNGRRQSHVDHGIFSKVRNAAKFSLSVRDQIDTRRTSKSIGNAVDSQNQLDKTSRPVSHMSLAEDNSNVGVAVKSKNDLVCTEDEHKFAQSMDARKSRRNSNFGGVTTRDRKGSLSLDRSSPMSLKNRGATPKNSDLAGRRKSLKGGEQLSEYMGRRKSLKGDQLLASLDRKKSLKNPAESDYDSRRRSIRLHESLSEEELESNENIVPSVSEPTAPPELHLLGSVRVKELWIWAFCSILRSNKMKNAGGLNQKLTPADRTESERKFTASYDLNTIRNFIQISRIFNKKKNVESDEDFAELNSILGVTPFFSKFPQDLRPRLYKEVHFATYPKGKKLIKETNQAECCYILILGEIIQFSESSVSRINELGNIVGEFLSTTPSEPRNYSATCLMQTSVVYVPKQIWLKYSREAKQYEAYQLDALSNVKFFKNYAKPDLIKICARGYIRYFNPVTFILQSGEPSDSIYFIIKGKVQILHLFEFVKSIDHFIDRKYTISAYNGNNINEGDELVKELGLISELVPGNFFPPITSTPTLFKSIINPWSYLSGDCTVEVFVMPKSDLLEVIPDSLISDLKTVSFFPTRETLVLVQDRYLFLHGWAEAWNDSHISERISNEIVKRGVTFENFCKVWGA